MFVEQNSMRSFDSCKNSVQRCAWKRNRKSMNIDQALRDIACGETDESCTYHILRERARRNNIDPRIVEAYIRCLERHKRQNAEVAK